MRMRVTGCDVAALQARVPQAKAGAMFVVAANVRSDCEPYVPKLSGDLRLYGRERVLANGDGEVEWGGDAKTAKYARRQHDHEHANYTTPGTGSHWTSKAKAERGEAWAKMFGVMFGRGLRG